MKKITKTIIAIMAVSVGTVLISDYSSSAHSNASGAPQGRTGSPGDGLNCTNGCHTGTGNPVNNPGMITSTVPSNGYTPGNTYTITVTAAAIGPSIPGKYGFQVSPQNAAGAQRGTLVVTNASQTQLVGGTKYITHTNAGTAAGVGVKTWSFNWIAPASGSGAVTLYGAIVFANGTGTNSGDIVALSNLTVQEATSSISESAYTNVASWSVYPNPTEDKIQIENSLLTEGKFDVSIYDITGKKVKEVNAYNIMQKPIIDIADLVNGVYVVSIEGEMGIINKKIIKR